MIWHSYISGLLEPCIFSSNSILHMYMAASRVHANPTNFQASIVFQPVIAQRHSPFYERDRKLSHLTLHRNVVSGIPTLISHLLQFKWLQGCYIIIIPIATEECCHFMRWAKKISIDIFSQFAQCATPLFG